MKAAPDPIDVTDFQFQWLTKIKLLQSNDQEDINPKAVTQRLSVSNKLGLVFAGNEPVKS